MCVPTLVYMPTQTMHVCLLSFPTCRAGHLRGHTSAHTSKCVCVHSRLTAVHVYMYIHVIPYRGEEDQQPPMPMQGYLHPGWPGAPGAPAMPKPGSPCKQHHVITHDLIQACSAIVTCAQCDNAAGMRNMSHLHTLQYCCMHALLCVYVCVGGSSAHTWVFFRCL